MIKVIIDINKVKIIYTYQGIYLKTKEPYKYMIAIVPINTKISNILNTIFEIEIDSHTYKKQKLFRFENL